MSNGLAHYQKTVAEGLRRSEKAAKRILKRIRKREKLRMKNGKLNMNRLAQQIAKREGLRESVSIAQIKEILAIALEELANFSDDELKDILARYRIERT